MGIQDRDYYRNDGPSAFDSFLPGGLVCRWLIAINVVAWLIQVATQPGPDQASWFTEWFILDVSKVLEGQVWRLMTFAFLHDPDLASLHLIFNMLFLWWFGSDIEQVYGRKEFLAIYLVSAVLGGLAYAGWGVLQSTVRPCLGASGAVTTLLVLSALHFPRRIIYVFLVLPMPLWAFAAFNVARDAYHWFHQSNTGVAVVVHLAGAGFGLAYFKWQGRLTGLFSGMLWWRASYNRPRLRLYRPDPDKEVPVAVSANSAPSTAVDEHLEAKLDAVLEKIAKWGKGSLTQQDEEVLKQAAEMYKRRRT